MIENQIHARIEAITAQVLPNQAPENTPTPYLLYTVLDAEPQRTLNGMVALTKYTVGIEAWADSLNECNSLLAQVRSQLDRYQGGDIHRAFCTDPGRGEQADQGFYKVSTYTVWATDTTVGPSIRGTGTTYANSNAEFSHTVLLPSAQDGDTQVVVFRTTDANPTATGWTNTSMGNDLWAMHKAYTAGNDVTINLDADNPLKATAFTLIGQFTVDASASATTTSTTAHAAPAVTSTTTSGIMFVSLSTQASNHTHTYPVGLTGVSAGPGGNKLSTCYEPITATGSTGTRTFTTSITTNAETGTILFKPAV
jgi:hypothetical protein